MDRDAAEIKKIKLDIAVFSPRFELSEKETFHFRLIRNRVLETWV